MRPDGLLARLAREEDGFVLVFVAICIPALLGLIGLAIDGGRLMALDTRLAAVADAAALAAASELDRSEEAIDKAERAALALANRTPYAERARGGPRLAFRFAATLEDLRADPDYTLSGAGGAQAFFVEVTTAPYSLTASFLQLVGKPIRRRAIAEAQNLACDVTPAVMCQSDPERFAQTARLGRQYLLRMDGNIADGSIALLDRPDDGSPRSALRSLASNAPAFCHGDDVALRRNVAAQDFDDAVNIRFDRYFNGAAAIASDLAVYPPAPNVIQGRHLNSCASPPRGGDVNPPFHLPRDQAFRTAPQSAAYDQGLGDWALTPAYGIAGQPPGTKALDEYILWNHADKDRGFQDRLRASGSRYEIYLKELGLTPEEDGRPVRTAGNALAGKTMPTGGPLAGPFAFQRESPIPICYPGTQPSTDPRRRVLYLSVVDCRSFAENATAVKLSRNVAKVFLTEPALGGMALVEFVRMLRPRRDDGKLHAVIHLVETD